MSTGKDGGWILPDPIDPGTRRCICIPVPDSPEHRQAFIGALTELGYMHNWKFGPTTEASQVSTLWMSIIRAALVGFEDGTTMCFSCEQLQECLQPLLDAQTAQFQRMLNHSKYGTDYPPDVPLPDEVVNADQAAGTNPTCDLDILWAQSLQCVQYANQLIVDVLERIEAATNDIEIVHVLTEITGLDETSADAVVGYVNLLQEGLSENYLAEYTEAYEQQAACAIFCLCRDDCKITLERIYSVFFDRVVAFFGPPGEAINTLADLLLRYLSAQEITATTVVDVLMSTIWGGGVLANIFLGDMGTQALQTLLALAVNDANSDWELLCDCPDICTDTYNFVVDAQGWQSSIRAPWNADYIDATGWQGVEGNPTPSEIDFEIIKAYTDPDIIEVRVFYDLDEAGGAANIIGIVDSNADGSVITGVSGASAALTAGTGQMVTLNPTGPYTIVNGYIGININQYPVSGGAAVTITKIEIDRDC